MKKITIILTLITLLIFSGCKKDFLNVNEDPSNTRTATVQMVLPAAIGSTCYVVGGWYQLLGGFWSQHWTQAIGAPQWRDIDSYNLTTNDFDQRQYGELYSGALNDYKYIRKVALADKNWSYYLIATVMEAYTFQVLADLYDQIPFTDALQGDDGNFSPHFDLGQNVYDALIVRLDEALTHDYKTFKSNTNPNATAIEPGADDLIFGGDMDNWEAFANTLKLKIFMRQSYVRPAVASAGIEAMYAANAPFLTTDAKMTQFADQENKRNPIYETGVDRLNGNISASYTLLNFLQVNSDPRLDAIFDPPSAGGSHKALPQGDFYNPDPSLVNIADLSTPKLSGLDAVYLISKPESYFLQAEAIVRGWGAGSAKTEYDNGISASLEKFGIAGADSIYGPGGVYEFEPGKSMESQIEKIIVQKWIALANSQSLETWIEQGRTHYPELSIAPVTDTANYVSGRWTVSVNNVTGNKLPKRLLFPESEIKRNPNTPALKPITDKIWWDTK
jgi:hypothetical protein